MKNLLVIAMVFFAAFSMAAQEKKNKNAKYTVGVDGNCEQCKKRIEKAAYSVAGVKSAIWDIQEQKLALIINEEKTTLNKVEKAVAGVGHDTQSVRADDKTYSNLHHCCLYERKPE